MPHRLTEDDLIAHYFAPLAGPAGLGLRDDAALLEVPPDSALVVTADALVAGVHFFADDPPQAIARKALRVNLSDLAAKAATPIGFTLSLALPASCDSVWLEDFARGLGDDARHFAIPLIGGDTVSTPGPLMIAITAFGCVPRSTGMVPRTGAQAGDLIYVSGTIGDAALGLGLRKTPGAWPQLGAVHRAFLLERYLLPQPRLGLQAPLANHAHAAMDISDGLVGDVGKMLRVSGITGAIDLARLPLSLAARAMAQHDAKLIATIATGGDDYEIACTIAPDQTAAFETAAKAAGIAVTCIGECRAGEGDADSLGLDGRPMMLTRGSFSHF